jgi:putative radical SAM enzyme (TIGR03279 family)
MPISVCTPVEIEKVIPQSPAAQAGIKAGDRLLSINRKQVRDVIDLMVYGGEPELRIVIQRKKERITCIVRRSDDHRVPLGIILKPMRVRTCGNKCLFCFVLQLPKGLRKSLYQKDEDYRFSFLYGNYITLTNLKREEKRRIVEQYLSPLYISVHATDRKVRNTLLGNETAPDIFKELKYFAEHNIRMHTQIVLCPGYNDGAVLSATINDLYRLYPYVQSIAVVPVGLTAHRRTVLTPVGKDEAVAVLDMVHRFQHRFRRKHGEAIVFAADEFYLKAGKEIPPLEAYEDLPQIENGVGMVALFQHQARRLKLPEMPVKRRFVTVTGTSFAPLLRQFVERLRRKGIELEVVAVENDFFGKSITVAGLLTGRDILRTLSGSLRPTDVLLIPDVMLREGDHVFLDDVTVQDVEDILGVRTFVIPSSPKGLIDGMVRAKEVVRGQ